MPRRRVKRAAVPPFDMRVPWDKFPIELQLDIVDYLSQAELSRLIRVDRISSALFQPLLYQRDIRTGESNAIQWAVKHCVSRGSTCARTLSLSIENGGDVNKIYKGRNGDTATALHFAAAQGSATFVKLLLEAGASVNICARDSILFSESGIEVPFELQSAIWSRTKWYPLLSPFLKGHEDVVQALLKAGAPAELAIQQDDPQTPDSTPTFAVTIHHVLALKCRKVAESNDYRQFHLYRPSIDSKLPGTGSTALHLSISKIGSLAFDSLIQARASIDVPDTNGRTPLCVAACLNEHNIETVIEWSQKCITTLLNRGANPQGSVNGFGSPLFILTDCLSLVSPSSKAVPQLIGLIDLMIRYGADPDSRDLHGHTALRNVFMTLAGKKCSAVGVSILSVFKQLLDRGASINSAIFPSRGSTLKAFIIEFNMVPLNMFRIIQEAGAELFPEEVDQVFEYWLSHKKLRDTSFDMFRYKNFVSAGAISDAYNKYLRCSNPAIFKLVYENFPVANSNERIVAALLKGPLCDISKEAKLPPNFDPNWLDEQGNSFLHMVVSGAESSRKYQLPISLANAKFLVDKGSSVLHLRQDGQTVLTRLDDRKGYEDLAQYLAHRQFLEYSKMADRL